MAKRRTAEDSEDESGTQPVAQSQKRARTSKGDRRTSSEKKPTGPGSDHEGSQEREDEDRIEAQYGEAVRASIHSNKGKSEGVSFSTTFTRYELY